MSRLTGTVQSVDEVGSQVEARMYALFERYYAATSRERFHDDLRAKQHVVLLHDDCGTLCGFTTLAVDEFDYGGMRRRSVFSGDTIIDHAYWGEQTLAFLWTALAGEIKSREPGTPLYWFLISKGFRTYRYLPAMACHFYPSWKEPTPPDVQALLDFIARRRFGDDYKAAEGVIRFSRSRGQLRPEWLGVPERERNRPDVSFFLERNPRHGEGEELACLAELSAENMRPLARRIFSRGLAA